MRLIAKMRGKKIGVTSLVMAANCDIAHLVVFLPFILVFKGMDRLISQPILVSLEYSLNNPLRLIRRPK